MRFADGNQVPAQVKGFDPFADVALLKIDPERPDAAPAAAGLDEGPARRRAGGGHRQPVRRGAVALGRRHLRARPLDPVADRLRHHRRDPDRRGDQPRQLGRPAARRPRPRARHQRPDPDLDAATARASASPSRPTRSGARWRQLRRDGRARYAYLGVASVAVYPQLAARFDLPVQSGAWIQDVTADGPAAARPPQGGRRHASASRSAPSARAATSSPRSRADPVHAESDLAKALLDYAPGDTVTLDVRRGGRAPAGAREAGRAAARRAAARLTQLLSRACSSRSPSDRRPSRTTRTSSGAISSRRSASSPSP